jgi:hypothetical protein
MALTIGDGDTSYVCGNCDHVLLSNVIKEQLSNILTADLLLKSNSLIHIQIKLLY